MTQTSRGMNGLGVATNLQALNDLSDPSKTQGMSPAEINARKGLALGGIASGAAGIVVDTKTMNNPNSMLGSRFGIFSNALGFVGGAMEFVSALRNPKIPSAEKIERLAVASGDISVSSAGIASSALSLAGKAGTAAGLGFAAAGGGAVLSGYKLRQGLLNYASELNALQGERAEGSMERSRFSEAGITPQYFDIAPLAPETKEFKQLDKLALANQANKEKFERALSDPEKFEKKLVEYARVKRAFGADRQNIEGEIAHDSSTARSAWLKASGRSGVHEKNQKLLDAAVRAEQDAKTASGALEELRGEFKGLRNFKDRMKEYNEKLAPIETSYASQTAELKKLRDTVLKVRTCEPHDLQAMCFQLGIQEDLKAQQDFAKQIQGKNDAETREVFAQKLIEANLRNEAESLRGLSRQERENIYLQNLEFIERLGLESRKDLSLVGLSTSEAEFQAKQKTFELTL